jgi:hypothetical protein
MDRECSMYWVRGGAYSILVGRHERRKHLKDPGVDGRAILRWIIRRWDMGVWTGLSWLRIGTGGGTCKGLMKFID